MGISRKSRILIPVGFFDVTFNQDIFTRMYVRICILVVEDQKKSVHTSTLEDRSLTCAQETVHTTGQVSLSGIID